MAKANAQKFEVPVCKMNVIKDFRGRSAPECTNCNHRFDTDGAENSYREMCRIAKGKFAFCPMCGAKYVGCQIEGVDFEKCSPDLRDWINEGLKPEPPYTPPRVWITPGFYR